MRFGLELFLGYWGIRDKCPGSLVEKVTTVVGGHLSCLLHQSHGHDGIRSDWEGEGDRT